MKTLIKYLIANLLLLNNSAFAAKPMDTARKVVGSSLAAAKQDASFLVRQDLEEAMLALIQGAQAGIQADTLPLDTQSVLQQLEVESLRLASTNVSNSELTRKNIIELWERYNQMVRQRLALSFQIQDRIQHSDQIFRNLEATLDSFSAVCRSGRSEKGIDYLVSPIPHVGGPQYSVSFGGQYNGQMSYDVKIESYSGTEQDKDRLAAGQVLYTAASVSSSIAYSGATGIAVTKAAAINPYLLGAVIVYGVVSHLLAAEDHAKLLNEIAEANRHMYEKTATEKDVAQFYRESCSAVQPVIARMKETLHALQESPEARMQLVTQAQNSLEERSAFARESANMAQIREWLLLFHAAKAQRCLNQSKQEPKETASCTFEKGVFRSVRETSISIGLDLANLETEVDQKTKALEDFGSRYSMEKRVSFVGDTLVDYLAPEWENTESHFLQFSFEASDALMQNAFQRVLLILGQYRMEVAKNWNTESDALFADQRKADQFELLKNQYRQIVGDGIRVLFNHLNREAFQKRVAAFLKEAKPFIKKGYSNSSVMKFSSLVNNFEQIYKKL